MKQAELKYGLRSLGTRGCRKVKKDRKAGGKENRGASGAINDHSMGKFAADNYSIQLIKNILIGQLGLGTLVASRLRVRPSIAAVNQVAKYPKGRMKASAEDVIRALETSSRNREKIISILRDARFK
ncbi:MAG: hypothetical protein ABIG96_01270 [Candidatus Micrarchaeota archaeon]